jgi:hypothetical protein
VPFAEEGIAAGEPVIIGYDDRKSGLLRAWLTDPSAVEFIAGQGLYATPAQAIATYRRLFESHLALGAAQIRIAGDVPHPPASLAQPSARLDLPSGQSVQLVCVHARPPKPWPGDAVARWRGELSILPPPGDTPVILAGDFNATLDHAQLRRLLRLGHHDAALQAGNALVSTWRPEPAGCPALLAIDHILIDPRCAVRATSVHRLPGSAIARCTPGCACPRRRTAPPRSPPEPAPRRHSGPTGRTAPEQGACREIRSCRVERADSGGARVMPGPWRSGSAADATLSEVEG